MKQWHETRESEETTGFNPLSISPYSPSVPTIAYFCRFYSQIDHQNIAAIKEDRTSSQWRFLFHLAVLWSKCLLACSCLGLAVCCTYSWVHCLSRTLCAPFELLQYVNVDFGGVFELSILRLGSLRGTWEWQGQRIGEAFRQQNLSLPKSRESV
jgi:hypothetical protein